MTPSIQIFLRSIVMFLITLCVGVLVTGIVNSNAYASEFDGWRISQDGPDQGAIPATGNPSTNPGGNPSTNPGGNPSTNPGGNPSTNPGGNPSTNPGNYSVLNPLRFPTIQAFFQAILDFLLILALPFIIFMIVYTGFLFVTAQGDTEKLKKARNMFMWTIIGGMIILGATVIAQVIKNTVDNITLIDPTRFL